MKHAKSGGNRMEDKADEKEVLQEILEKNLPAKFTQDLVRLAALDAFVQFAQNPTSVSAGYGIEENYPLIGKNLAKRYELERIVVDAILNFLKESFNRMEEVNYDVYFWRDAIQDYIKSKHINEFLEWYDSFYKGLSEEEKTKFLFLLEALAHTSDIKGIHRWFICFFDKEGSFSEGELIDALLRFGMSNILYYRSARGYFENQFVPSLFLSNLCERFKREIRVEKKQVEEFFNDLSLSDIKLLEKCIREPVPVLESRIGKISKTSRLILETSKSYFAISPFAVDEFKELIKVRKLELTRDWKKKFDEILSSFIEKVYPCAELKNIFEIEGAYCWEIRYTDAPDGEPISVGILLSPYIFTLSSYSTILDEMKRVISSQLNLVFLIRETLPVITECFRYVSERNIIFLLDEKGEKFYVIEKSGKLSEESALQVESFLSRFLPVAENSIQISKTWPSYLKDYIENLRYFNKFPRLVTIRNRLPTVELKMRRNIRDKLKKNFGDQWKEKVKEKLENKVKELEGVIGRRPDKEEIKDFLDGATLGDLVDITRTFSEAIGVNKSAMEHLNIITRYRKVLEHPLKDQEADLEEKTYNMLQIALDFIEKVICLE